MLLRNASSIGLRAYEVQGTSIVLPPPSLRPAGTPVNTCGGSTTRSVQLPSTLLCSAAPQKAVQGRRRSVSIIPSAAAATVDAKPSLEAQVFCLLLPRTLEHMHA